MTGPHLTVAGAPPRVGLVVLAAGASSRMGRPKAVCRVGGQTFLERILLAGTAADLAPVVVVLGPDRAAVVAEVALDGRQVLDNPEPASGPLGSLKIALRRLAAADPPLDAVVVAPVDQPLVTSELLRDLVAAFVRTRAPVVVPCAGGRRGHPTLFAARLFAELLAASPEEGARAVVRAHAAERVEVAADERVLCDADTPERLAQAEEAERLRRHAVLRVRDGAPGFAEDDAVAVEEPLEIRLAGEALAVTMRTPGNDEELARGFVVTEGIVPAAFVGAVGVRRVAPNVIDVLPPPGAAAARPPSRQFYASSSCGVCGKASLAALDRVFAPVEGALQLPPAALYGLPERLAEAQTVFARTGGLHAAACFDAEGRLLATREDVGRHNAVDKIVGWAAGAGALPLGGRGLLVSGRTSFEVVQKAVAAGIGLVAAVSAPSSLAVRLADERGVTLIGFLRGRSFNVYTHPRRIRER